MIPINRYPFANQVGVDAVPQGYAGDRDARLQAFLNDLGFKRFGIRASLAHGDPDDKGDGVHVFLSGEHRPYGWDQVGDFTGRLRCFHEQSGLRLPLGIYNVSVSRVCDKVTRLCRRLEVYFNAPDTLNPQGETNEELFEIIDYIELSLYAAAEHVDDISSIATGFFKHSSFRDKDPAYRALMKAEKQHKHFIASAANAIKHQQSRVRIGTIEFKDEGRIGALHGYFIEGVARGSRS